MKKTIIIILLAFLLISCMQTNEKTEDTKEAAQKGQIKPEKEILQEKEELLQEQAPVPEDAPEPAEATAIINVGETKTITIGERKYDTKLLSVSNRARFSINGELTKDIIINGVHTLRDQSEVQLLRILYNAAEIKVKAPPEKETEASEAAGPTGREPERVRTGIFTSKEKTTSGHAEIIRTAEGKLVLQLQGFITEPGAGLYIYLVNQNTEDGYEVARLTTISGGQTYNLHDDVDLNKYKKIVIYSKTEKKTYGEAQFS